MLKEVKKDIYKLVRQPYLKYGRLKYCIISLIVLVPNVGYSLFYSYSSSTHDFMDIIYRSEMFQLYKGVVQPFVMYFLPGLFYYKACIYFQDE